MSFVKAYGLLAKALLAQGRYADAALALANAPIALQAAEDMVAVREKTAESCKDGGNAAFRAKSYDAAFECYSAACELAPTNARYFSNRSACLQQQKKWREAARDGASVVKLEPTFAKGHLHLARSLQQLERREEAVAALEAGMQQVGAEDQAALKELLATMMSGGGRPASGGGGGPAAATAAAAAAAATTTTTTPSGSSGGGSGGAGATRAGVLKDQGNQLYKRGQYREALRLYSQAIAAAPEVGSIYGNRAACWMMVKEYQRASNDCAEGLTHERHSELFKVRVRQGELMID